VCDDGGGTTRKVFAAWSFSGLAAKETCGDVLYESYKASISVMTGGMAD
jgi:hypothetical protein